MVLKIQIDNKKKQRLHALLRKKKKKKFLFAFMMDTVFSHNPYLT